MYIWSYWTLVLFPSKTPKTKKHVFSNKDCRYTTVFLHGTEINHRFFLLGNSSSIHLHFGLQQLWIFGGWISMSISQGVTTSKRSNLEKDPSAPYGALLIGASPFLAVLFFGGELAWWRLRKCIGILTPPKFNSEVPLKIGRGPKRKGSFSKHHFSGAIC